MCVVWGEDAGLLLLPLVPLCVQPPKNVNANVIHTFNTFAEDENLIFPCEIIIQLPTFISIREIIVIALNMAKRTDLVDRPPPVDGLDTISEFSIMENLP